MYTATRSWDGESMAHTAGAQSLQELYSPGITTTASGWILRRLAPALGMAKLRIGNELYGSD